MQGSLYVCMISMAIRIDNNRIRGQQLSFCHFCQWWFVICNFFLLAFHTQSCASFIGQRKKECKIGIFNKKNWVSSISKWNILTSIQLINPIWSFFWYLDYVCTIAWIAATKMCWNCEYPVGVVNFFVKLILPEIFYCFCISSTLILIWSSHWRSTRGKLFFSHLVV